MATRFYFPETEAAAVSPAIQGTYLHTNTLRRRLLTTPDSSALTSTAYTPDAADHAVAGASHVRQYVSDQLSAQNISGTWKLQLQAFEPNANCNQSINVLIFVCSSDGTTIKETLFAQAVAGNELNTALRNLTASGSISAADVEANDRIVVQIGTSGTPAGGGGVQGHNSTYRWGCSASSGDLPENETETGTTFRGWIEFSDTLFTTPTRGRISWAELEAPFVATRGRVSWAELETPVGATRGRISFAELEVPVAPTRGRISFAELEVPNPPGNPTRGRISWAELETPFVSTRGRISWAEFEAPIAPTRGRISFAEFEVPLAPTRGRMSWAELEVPALATRGRISWAELEVPEVGVGPEIPYPPISRAYLKHHLLILGPSEPLP